MAPSSAGAATQVGGTFTPNTNCNLATYVHLGEPDGSYAVPSPGVITSWSFQAAATTPTLKFKLARPAGGDDYTIVGESAAQPTASNVLNAFPTRIPAQPGDVIGFHVSAPGNCRLFGAGSAGFTTGFYAGIDDPAVGSVKSFGPLSGQRLDVSAILEPDADCDGFGDESQDPAVDPEGCFQSAEPPAKANRSLTLDANKNKVKKGKKVRLSGRVTEIARQACQSGQTVELQRKRPKQTTFTTVETLQTDAAGNFSAKRKVKKTFRYRAQVAETANCLSGFSNTEKVKVKKPK
jgi:hypothetical protein